MANRKNNDAPLTRGEFLDAMKGMNKRFDRIDRILMLVIEALLIQDKQITDEQLRQHLLR